MIHEMNHTLNFGWDIKSSDAMILTLMNTILSIVGFHSRDQQPCFSTKTKENVCIIIEFNSQRIGSGHKYGRRAFVYGHKHGGCDVM